MAAQAVTLRCKPPSGPSTCYTVEEVNFLLVLLLSVRCKPASRLTTCHTSHKRRKLLQLLLHKNRKLSCPSSHTMWPSQAENTGLPGPERRSVRLPQSEDGIHLHNAKCSQAETYQRSDHTGLLHMCYACVLCPLFPHALLRGTSLCMSDFSFV